MSLCGTARGAPSDCEPPRSRMVLKRDLKDVYKSGKVISSKVKRSGGSVEEFNETTGATDDGTTHTEGGVGPGTVHTDTGAALGAQEKVGAHTELAGKVRVALEKEGATEEAADMLAADRGVAEAVGME